MFSDDDDDDEEEEETEDDAESDIEEYDEGDCFESCVGAGLAVGCQVGKSVDEGR